MIDRRPQLLGVDVVIDPRLASLLGSLVTALIATPLVIAVLRRVQVIDHPNERSSHNKPTVRGAGWAVLFATLFGWLAPDVLGQLQWWLPVCTVAYGLIGFVDDLRSLPVSTRFGLQLILSATAMAVAAAADVIELSLLLLPICVVMIVAYVNAFNFMDGVNAISGLQAAVVGGIIALAGADAGAVDVQIAGLAIAGAGLGFLPFNAIQARCFLGDVGSYFVGAWISMVCIVAIDRGVSPLVIASAMAIYAADTAYTLSSRMRRGERWWTAHREHVYQRLTDRGWTHLSSSATVTAFTVGAGLLALCAAQWNTAASVGAGLAVVALCGLYLWLPSLPRRETNTSLEASERAVTP